MKCFTIFNKINIVDNDKRREWLTCAALFYWGMKR